MCNDVDRYYKLGRFQEAYHFASKSRHKESRGLAQLVVPNVAWFYASRGSIRISSQSTLVYADGFTRDAIHKCGEAILGFLHEVFVGKNR